MVFRLFLGVFCEVNLDFHVFRRGRVSFTVSFQDMEQDLEANPSNHI